MWQIVPLAAAQARAAAECHIACWREAYRETVPAHVLAALDADRLAPRWAEWATGPRRTMAAVDGDTIVGVASADDELLHALYVRRSHQGTGLADELITATLGTTTVALWVFADNLRAQRFYRRHGFAVTAHRRVDPICNAEELQMVRKPPDTVQA